MYSPGSFYPLVFSQDAPLDPFYGQEAPLEPFYGHEATLDPFYGQEAPLDLSNKKVEVPTSDRLDMEELLRTYYLISLRNYSAYFNNTNQPDIKNKMSRNNKRKLTFEDTPKRAKRSAEPKLEGSSSPALKKRKTKKSSVAGVCNCRFCYEDHIIQMRTKQTHAT